jgi:hypothetical protein
MCTDFTDLNKRCPKDDFPLARIDKIVNSTLASKMVALLDCFSRYH